MNTLTLTKPQARRFLLAHQGLWPPYARKGKRGVLRYIRRVGCIQFDPLNIVGHNPDLVLQARVSDFQPSMRQELLYAERKLLDGRDKMMSIYRVEDWPYFRRRRASTRQRLGRRFEPVEAVLPQVRQAIDNRGPLSSLDLTFDQRVDWAWAPTRLARAVLETMYFEGELIIHHKVHTRKVYDFATRHLSEDLLSAPDPNETEAQYHDWHVLRRIGGVGLLWSKAGEVWLGILRMKSRERIHAIQRLLSQGRVLEVRVEGITAPLYMRSDDLVRFQQTLDADDWIPHAAVLAPLDNLLWDRQLIREVFAFDYLWEVYKPVAERRYGYYVLPVLYGDRFVARFEPGREKPSGAFVIKNWWWEANVHPSETLYASLRHCFTRFLTYLGTDRMTIDRTLVEREHLQWLTPITGI
jgi:uncharacterized protein YcaQ